MRWAESVATEGDEVLRERRSKEEVRDPSVDTDSDMPPMYCFLISLTVDFAGSHSRLARNRDEGKKEDVATRAPTANGPAVPGPVFRCAGLKDKISAWCRQQKALCTRHARSIPAWLLHPKSSYDQRMMRAIALPAPSPPPTEACDPHLSARAASSLTISAVPAGRS